MAEEAPFFDNAPQPAHNGAVFLEFFISAVSA